MFLKFCFVAKLDPITGIVEADDLFVGLIALADHAETFHLKAGQSQFLHRRFRGIMVGKTAIAVSVFSMGYSFEDKIGALLGAAARRQGPVCQLRRGLLRHRRGAMVRKIAMDLIVMTPSSVPESRSHP